MKDPRRWRDGNSGADAETRALLASDQAEAPSPSQRDRIWAGLVPHVQILPPPPSGIPAAPVVASGTAALLGKITLGVVLVAAVGTGVQVARTRAPTVNPGPAVQRPALAPPETAPPVVSPTEMPTVAAASTPAQERSSGRRSRSAAHVPALARAPEVHEPAPAAPVVVSNKLLEEGRRLSRARAALRIHDPESALRLLQSGPAGSAGLAQEREALTIEALAARPQSHAEATKRARAFMVAYPVSPYRARIKALVFQDR